MTETLLQIGLSNLCVSLAIALVAWTVQRTAKRPLLAHLLWALVLVKLVTPPLWTVPVVPVPGTSSTPVETTAPLHEPGPGTALVQTGDVEIFRETEEPAPVGATVPWPIKHGKNGMALLWLLGSMSVLVWSLVRVFRFNRLFWMASEKAPPEVQNLVLEIAHRLGLKSAPILYTTSAQLSPLVWWIGGRVRVLIPAALVREMNEEALRWILSHELAHVRRKDHLVRWLEWLACVCFWWNPVAWWARRNLRANEEVCCDALVLESLKPNPRTYANSLLAVVEFLTAPALRPPAMASEINGGGFLERRFKMIVSKEKVATTPLWLRGIALVAVVVLLPLGVVYAQEPDFKAVGERLIKAVQAGELTPEQASAMMGELARASFAQRLQAATEKRGPRRSSKRVVREDTKRVEDARRKAAAARKLTEKDARARLEAMRKAMVKRREAGTHRREDERVAKYRAVAAKIGELVKAGKMSKKDAEKKLIALRKEMFDDQKRRTKRGAERSHRERPRTTDARAQYQAYAKRIADAVKAGKMSKKDAARALEGLKKRMSAYEKQRGERKRGHGEPEKKRTTDAKAHLEAYAKRIHEAVKAGKMSKKDASRALEGLKKRMAAYEKQRGERKRGRGEREGRRKTDAEAKYEAYAKRIYEAVKAGKISKKDAARALEAYKKRLSGGGEKRQGERRERDAKRKYEEFAKKIYAAVKAGKISKEDAAKKLGALRRQMFGGAEKRQGEHKRGGRGPERRSTNDVRAKVEAYAKRLYEAVKAGKVTKKDAERALEVFKKRLSGGSEKREGPRRERTAKRKVAKRGSQRETRNAREDRRTEAMMEAVRKRILVAVKEGRLTEAQAKERWEAYLKRIRGSGSERKRSERGERPREDERLAKYRAIEKEIWAAVKAGKMSKKEAEKKLEAIKKSLFGSKKRRNERRERDRRLASREEMEKVRGRIWEAVKAGKISEEKAGEAWEAYLTSLRRGDLQPSGR
ncbi:MAG: M56 family metallopeptidase [Planctomycetota bacterium]|jgi:beta-lactamase regulating signal transducer with metallopeptidase domain